MTYHQNAFASTVARDSVRNCDENNQLIKKVAKLVADSISEIKKMGLLTVSFFEILPNYKDNLSSFYETICDFVCVAFRQNAYLPTKENNCEEKYVTTTKALIGPTAISNILSSKDIKTLFCVDKIWIQNVMRNSNADFFIRGLDISDFSYGKLMGIFNNDHEKILQEHLSTKKAEWMKKFYLLVTESCNELGNDKYYIRNIQRTSFILSNNNKFYNANEIYILPKNTELINQDTPIIHQDIVSWKKDSTSEKLLSFFKDQLKIREYGQEVEIEKLLNKYNTYHLPLDVDKYFDDILTISKYVSKKDIFIDDIYNYKLFLYEEDDEIYKINASELVIGSVYGFSSGELIADVYGKWCLWDEYKHRYSEKELQYFMHFLEVCGVQTKLEIVTRNVEDHPLYNKYLYVPGNRSRHMISCDYTIQYLGNLLEQYNISINKTIWDTLCANKENRRYAIAEYSPNNTAGMRKYDSTLIYYLKEYSWLPDQNGKLYRPGDISVRKLHRDFQYDPNNVLLAALEIGSSKKKEREEQNEIFKKLQEMGYGAIPNEEKELYEKFKKLYKVENKIEDNSIPSSLRNLLEKQTKNEKERKLESILMPSKPRVDDIEKSFKHAEQMQPPIRKVFSKTMSSTKEEKKRLYAYYGGVCQMCGTIITKHNQERHFVARNIIYTQDLTIDLRKTEFLAWNSLCLCPNCATKYNVCTKDITGLYDQIMKRQIPENSKEVFLTIELDGKLQEIRYDIRHFLTLRKAFQLIEESLQND